MKTPMKRTVFKVILRKSEYKEQWSLLIESFPVFEPGKDKPLRKHEPLGRFITTPIFDKNSSGRTLADGKAYYRPKRDANGIILCRSQKDQEACIFADKVRDLRHTNTIISHCTQIVRLNKQHKTKGQSATLSSTLKS